MVPTPIIMLPFPPIRHHRCSESNSPDSRPSTPLTNGITEVVAEVLEGDLTRAASIANHISSRVDAVESNINEADVSELAVGAGG